jgi:hypothetical protein
MKQNFMFQTQMKFLEEKVSKIPEMEEKLASVESDKNYQTRRLQSFVE